MSYDYLLLRLVAPVASLREVDGAIVSAEDWSAEARSVFARLYGHLQWQESHGALWGNGNSLGTGRLEVRLGTSDSHVYVSVNGSFRSDQRDFVRQLASDLKATALDLQTGEVVAKPAQARCGP